MKAMKSHIDNLNLDIYPESMEYLTGSDLSEGQRCISKETLQKFRVGLGEEKFFDYEEEAWKVLPCVYFPMYAPLTEKQAKTKKSEYKKKMGQMIAKERNIFHEEVEAVEASPPDGTENLKEELLDQSELRQSKKELEFSFEFVKTKVRALGAENKKHQRTLPAGCSQQAMFGLTTVKESDTFLVITEGEYDAMAVHQAT